MDRKCYQIKIFSLNFTLNLGYFAIFLQGAKRTSKQIYNGNFLETTPIMLSSVALLRGEGVGYTPS